MIGKILCWFGFHNVVIDEEVQALLREAMKDALAKACKLDNLYDGTPVLFKKCRLCGKVST